MLQHGPVLKEAITFRLLLVWMPALHPQAHSLAQPLSVRRKQWFSAPRKQLPRVVYQLPTEAATTVLQWVKAQPQLARTGSITNVVRVCVADFKCGKATQAQLVSEAWDAGDHKMAGMPKPWTFNRKLHTRSGASQRVVGDSKAGGAESYPNP